MNYLQDFIEKAKNVKTIGVQPTVTKKVNLLVTNDYYIVYSHSKGSHWNVFGNHYYYLHDRETGEYKGAYDTITGFKIEADIKILKADYIKLFNNQMIFHTK